MSTLDERDLERLDAAVRAAIAAGEAGDLRILGYGEITLVLGWPTERPTYAVKRLPPFAQADRLDDYREIVARYAATLRDAGVAAVDTQVRALPPGPYGIPVYLVQPLLPADRLLTNVLRDAGDARGAALLEQIVEHVAGTVTRQVGLDAQGANWVVDGERLRYMDLSTPMLRPDGAHDALDTSIFLSAYPWALRPMLSRVARLILGQYFDRRAVLVDVASNLLKEHLDRWLPVLLEATIPHLDTPISEREVRSYFARDRRFWQLTQRLRRIDRSWQRSVRRRPYPLLLAPPYDYAPTELPERKHA